MEAHLPLLGTPEPAPPDEAPLSVARWKPLCFSISSCLSASKPLVITASAWASSGGAGAHPLRRTFLSPFPMAAGKLTSAQQWEGAGQKASPAEAPGELKSPGELCPWGSMVADWLLVYQELAGRTHGAFCPSISQRLTPSRIEASLFWV